MMQDAASARVVQKSQKTEITYCAAHPPVVTSGGIHSWQSYTHFASPRHYKICWRHHLDRGYTMRACGNINQIQRSIRLELQLLLRQQLRIGWRQVFNGRFSTEWARIQDAYYHRTSSSNTLPSNSRSGHKWQIKLITFIWEKWHTLWKMRNQDVYGKDAITIAQAEARDVRRNLELIYAQRQHMEPSAQSLLCHDIRTHMQRPTWVTREWITIHAPLFKASLQRARKRAIQGVRSIRTYFGPAGDT